MTRHRSPTSSPRDLVADEVRTELDAHLAALIDENLRRGMSRMDAEREAAARFGQREAIEAASTRVRRGPGRLWRALGPDTRDAARRLVRHPVSATCAVIVAAVGLATVLSSLRLADALLVRPPVGVVAPENLYSVLDAYSGGDGGLVQFQAFRAMSSSAPDLGMFAWDTRDLQIVAGPFARSVQGVIASGQYFQTLGLRPAAGRLLDAQDDDSARPSTVVSDRLARQIATRPAAAIGMAIRVNGHSFVVVGVAPAGFNGIESGHPADLWLPLSSEPTISTATVLPDGRVIQGFRNTPGLGWLRLGVRRQGTATTGEVEGRLTPVLRGPALPQLHMEKRRASVTGHIWLSPFSGDLDRIAGVVRIVAWAAAMTMFLAAVCLAGIFVGRLADAAREVALRVAIGASRARLLRVAAMELLLAILVGTALAIPMSIALLASASGLQLTTGVAVGDAVLASFDLRAAEMAGVLTAMMAAASAVAPLLVVWRLSRATRVESTRATVGGARLRRLLLIAQVAAGCAFLSGALLLTRSIAALKGQALGYDAEHVAFAELDPAGAGVDAKAKTSIMGRLASGAMTTDVDLAFADSAPYGGSRQFFFSAVGSTDARRVATPITQISASYFRVLGVSLVEGRAFASEDAGQPVAILSEPLARHYWPNGDALGHIVLVGGPGGVAHRVVGVVAGLRDASLKGQPGSRVYIPYNEKAESLFLLARKARARPADLVRSLLGIAQTLDDRMVLIRSGSLLDLAWRTIEQRALIRLIVVTIGLGSLIMIATGVWGLSHSSLRRRWREFGIRRALGATTSHIRRLAFADAVVVTSAGAIAGLGASLGIGSLLKIWLYGVTEHDPLSLTGGVALVVVATMMGALWPARAAGRLEPTLLLRDDQ